MANRNLPQSSMRQVTNVVAETGAIPDNAPDIAAQVANIGVGILRQNEEAKVVENFSQLQLDLSQVELEYKNEFASNPSAGFGEYKKRRQKLVDKYAGNISPLYRGQWNQSVRGLAAKKDAVQEAWVYTKTRENSVAFVNNSIENNLNQAMNDGMSYGENGGSIVDALANFSSSLESIESYALNNLGEVEAQKVIKDYKEDAVKSFVSGASFNNPSAALELLEDDDIKNAFSDPEQYTQMHDSITRRRDRKLRAERQVAKANSMSATNSIAETVNEMNYAQLQQSLEKSGASSEAKKFYMDVSGYTSQKKALQAGEKVDLKNKFFITMTDFAQNDKVTSNDMEVLQDATYKAMRKGALTKTEGFGFLNNLLEPLIAKQIERAEVFEAGDWNPFYENLGLDTLKEEVKKISGFEGENVDKLTSEQYFNLNKNKNLMYDVYLQTLGKEAQNRGVTVADLGDLGAEEETKIYNKALNSAKSALLGKNFPSAPEGTNTVIQSRASNAPKIGFISLNESTGVRYKFKGGNPNQKSNWEAIK